MLRSPLLPPSGSLNPRSAVSRTLAAVSGGEGRGIAIVREAESDSERSEVLESWLLPSDIESFSGGHAIILFMESYIFLSIHRTQNRPRLHNGSVLTD